MEDHRQFYIDMSDVEWRSYPMSTNYNYMKFDRKWTQSVLDVDDLTLTIL